MSAYKFTVISPGGSGTFREVFNNREMWVEEVRIECLLVACNSLDAIDRLLETVPDLEVSYWVGYERITRTSTVMRPPVHTRAAYCKFRTPAIGKE